MRAARPDDPVPELLYLSAAPYYAAFAGGARHARALLARLYPRRGHTASWEVCRVAVVDGAVAGVLAAFPADRGDELARRFVRLTLARTPPWRLPALFRHLQRHRGRSRRSRRAACSTSTRWPRTPTSAAAASPPRCSARPTGWPRAPGLPAVALDTGIENRAARALYERSGFTGRGLRPAPTSASPAPSAARASSATSSRD